MHEQYEGDRLATPSEACREYAQNYGMDNPSHAWVLTPWDSWERNPYYSGPPVPHPEDDCENHDESNPHAPDTLATPEVPESSENKDIPF